MSVNLDDLRRLRDEAMAAGPGSGKWIRAAQKLMDVFPELYATAQVMNENRAKLAEENADLRKDAERYRWLREQHLVSAHLAKQVDAGILAKKVERYG